MSNKATAEAEAPPQQTPWSNQDLDNDQEEDAGNYDSGAEFQDAEGAQNNQAGNDEQDDGVDENEDDDDDYDDDDDDDESGEDDDGPATPKNNQELARARQMNQQRAGQVAEKPKGDGGDDGKKPLKLRLDLNLEVDIELKARIHGDLTLALLEGL